MDEWMTHLNLGVEMFIFVVSHPSFFLSLFPPLILPWAENQYKQGATYILFCVLWDCPTDLELWESDFNFDTLLQDKVLGLWISKYAHL